MRRDLLPALSWTCVLLVAYAWKLGEIEGAGNLLRAFCWIVGVMGFGLIFMKGGKPNPPSRWWAARIAVLAWFTTVVSLTWWGHFGLAALLVLCSFGMHVYRQPVEPKKAEG